MPSSCGNNTQPCLHYSYKKLLFFPLATLAIFGFLINMPVSLLQSGGSLSPVCVARRNIVFLKTHKCAGSSLQNILMRFGDAHRLNFVLPTQDNYLGHPAPFSRTLLPNYRTKSIPYNILAHHTRFDYREISAIMPRDSVYLTIVRDPSFLFESAFHYYSLDRLYRSDIHAFISYLPRLQPSVLNRRLKGRYGINQMYFDLGGDGLNNETTARRYIGQLDAWFDLVLVAERMDESLILLRHVLCWDMDQVVTFKLNARADKFKTNLTEPERDEVLRLNRADVLLYLHFYDKLEREVESFGRDRMAFEVSQLQKRTTEWFNLCVQGQQLHPTDSHRVTAEHHYHNPRVMVFQTRSANTTCSAMTREELDYTDMLRRRQVAMYPGAYRVLTKHPSPYKSSRFRNLTKGAKTYRDIYKEIQSRKMLNGLKRYIPFKNVSKNSDVFRLSNSVSKDSRSYSLSMNDSKYSDSFMLANNVSKDPEVYKLHSNLPKVSDDSKLTQNVSKADI